MMLDRACCRFTLKKSKPLLSSIVVWQPRAVIRVEASPGLLPTLPRSRAVIQLLLDEGRLNLNSAEGALEMDGVTEDFPTPKSM